MSSPTTRQTTQAAASAGAEKLVSLIHPMIVKLHAEQNSHLQEFIKQELSTINASLTESIADMQLNINNLKVRVGTIERELYEIRKSEALNSGESIMSQLEEVNNRISWVHTAVIRLNLAIGNSDDINKVQGLPPSAIMTETGPGADMFGQDDDLHIDCD